MTNGQTAEVRALPKVFRFSWRTRWRIFLGRPVVVTADLKIRQRGSKIVVESSETRISCE